MPEETKKMLQEIIDHNFELAKKTKEESLNEHGIEKDIVRTFCYFVCWDLQREFGLDLKGVVPE